MFRKNTAGQFICVQMILTATGAVGTGVTLAARRCLDGTFGAGGGTFTEDGTTGSYKYAMAQADTNANNVSIIVTGTGVIPVCVNFVTTAADPTDSVRLGLTGLANAVPGAAGGLFIAGTNAATTITTALTTTFTGNLTGSVASVTGAAGSVTGNVGGNVTGTVGSVVGAVGSVTGAVGSVTGNVGGNVVGSVASVTADVNVTSNINKNAASRITFVMTDSTTHAPKTGVTVTAQRSLDGGALGSCANSVSEIGSGLYTLVLDAADTNANELCYRFTGASSDDLVIERVTQP